MAYFVKLSCFVLSFCCSSLRPDSPPRQRRRSGSSSSTARIRGTRRHDITDQGIRAAFRSNTRLRRPALHRIPGCRPVLAGPGHASAVADYLRRKYAGMKIDAIITVYPQRRGLPAGPEACPLPGVPVIACEIGREFAREPRTFAGTPLCHRCRHRR